MSNADTPNSKSTIEQDLRNLINRSAFTGEVFKTYFTEQAKPITSPHVSRFVEDADTLASLFAKLRDLDAQRENLLTKIARLKGEGQS
jgi:hypothetical protein